MIERASRAQKPSLRRLRLAAQQPVAHRSACGRRSESSTGCSVTAPMIETTGIRKPATPSIRMNGSGIATSSDEPERDGDAGEDDRAAGGLHRADDGVVDLEPARELLAEAVDDQQRVVDGDPEPDQLDEVRRVGRRRPDARDAVDDPERAGDRARREDQRDRHRPREPEDGEQHEQRDRQRDRELAVLQVAVEDRVEVVLDRGGAGDVDVLDPGGVPSAAITLSV